MDVLQSVKRKFKTTLMTPGPAAAQWWSQPSLNQKAGSQAPTLALYIEQSHRATH